MSLHPPLLHHEVVVAEGAHPGRWIYILHGIFGSGRNWASVARRLVRARPEWGAILVDLREHGASQGFPPPHTLDACAADLEVLAQETGRSADAVAGHSFGGKVAMNWVARGLRPDQLWVVDSTPEARPEGGSAHEMLERLRGLPGPFRSRDELVESLREQGLSEALALWMATNLIGDREQGFRWRFDLDSLEALLSDFARRDLWALLEAPPSETEIHLIRAEGSNLLSGRALARAEGLAEEGRIHLHPVSGGHWVNADNPEALHALLVDRLPGGTEELGGP
jgi:esterase